MNNNALPQTHPTVCLSVQQPSAWMIVHGFKKMEEFSWPTEFRGRVLIHAAEVLDEDQMDWFELEFGRSVQIPKFGKAAPTHELEPVYRGSQLGGIIGEVDIVNCVRAPESESYAGGEYRFTLANSTHRDFIPCARQSGLFPAPLTRD